MRKGIFNTFFVYIHIFREQYSLEATSGQSLSNQPSIFTFSLKVAWSGISLILHLLEFLKTSRVADEEE